MRLDQAELDCFGRKIGRKFVSEWTTQSAAPYSVSTVKFSDCGADEAERGDRGAEKKEGAADLGLGKASPGLTVAAIQRQHARYLSPTRDPHRPAIWARDVGCLASSTSRTLAPKDAGVNGFVRKATSASSTPWRTTASSA
jgi:hypothetical protein